MRPLHTHPLQKSEIPVQVVIKCKPSHKFPDKQTCSFFDFNEVRELNKPRKPVQEFAPDIIEANIRDIWQIPQKSRKAKLPKPIFSVRTRPGLISIKGPPPYKCTVVPTLVGQDHLKFGPQGVDIDYDKVDFLVDCKSAKMKPSEGKRIAWGRI